MKRHSQFGFSVSNKLGTLVVLALLNPLLLGGCQITQMIDDEIAYCEPLDDCLAECRTHLEAYKGWRNCGKACFEGDPHQHYIKDGFMDGFSEVCRGGPGCVPAIPPRRYWKSCYETAEGQLKICAYFQGYSEGVRCAYQCGCARSTRLWVSPQSVCPTCPVYQGYPGGMVEPGVDPTLDGYLPAIPAMPMSPHALTPDQVLGNSNSEPALILPPPVPRGY